MKKLFIILAFSFQILILSSNFSHSQQLTWQDVLAEAKTKNPDLIKAEKGIKKARLSYYSSFTNFLPQLSASAGAGQSKSSDNSESKNYSYGLSGRLSLFSGFSDISQSQSSNIGLKIAELEYKRALSDMVFSLKQSFVNLLLAQETVVLTEAILKRRSENYELVKFKYDAGIEDKGSLLRVDADKLQAEYELARAKRALGTASTQMVRDIGRDEFEVISVTGTFTVVVPKEVPASNELLIETPDYLIAEYNVEKSRYDLKSTMSELYPDVSLSGNISQSGNKWAPENRNESVSLGLSYSFFPGGRNIYDVKIAKTNVMVVEQTLRFTRQQIMSRLESVWNDFIDTFENVKVSEKYLEASQEQSEIASTKYINGLVSYQDWYVVENDYINAQKSLLSVRKNAVLSEASWKNILGLAE
ncbi:MAG: TolC family protein [Elusimicrobia bacterium]|nr:TolC family protein [Elusimicrobiota bacterium]